MTARQPASALTDLASAILRASEVLPKHANITASRLVEADLRGRSGHGLIRLRPYVERIRAGGINLRPDIAVTHDTPVSAQVDGDNGLGQVVMTKATELAIAKASTSGLAWVGTVHSNHAGAAGLYAEQAADAGLVAMYFAVANANGMPPWGGTEPMLGTNPIAIAMPTKGTPFVLDVATTATSHGTIKVHAREGKPLPEGWVVDKDGRPITDATRAGEGYLVPMGGYKGSGLTIAIGLLAGVLNGAAFGSDVVDHRRDQVSPTNTGQSILVMRPDLFRAGDEVLADLTRHLDALRDAGGTNGRPVRLPGDEAARVRAENQEQGVPLSDSLANELARTRRRTRRRLAVHEGGTTMKLVTFQADAGPAVGVLDGDEIVALAADPGLPAAMVDFVALGAQGLERAAALVRTAPRIPADGARLLAPIRPRNNVMCVGKNYHEHAREFAGSGFDASAKQTIPDAPVIFTKALSAIVGQGDDVRVSDDATATSDYEGELGVVLGPGGHQVSEADAPDHVYGYTIVNDVTIRDLQKRHVQFFIGKSAATYCPIGPVLVTADEVDDAGSLRVQTRINGELRQDAPVKDLIFDIPRLISSISAAVRLEAGDVIATGTPAGVGLGFDPPRFLAPGDVMEVTIDGIGTLTNPCV